MYGSDRDQTPIWVVRVPVLGVENLDATEFRSSVQIAVPVGNDLLVLVALLLREDFGYIHVLDLIDEGGVAGPFHARHTRTMPESSRRSTRSAGRRNFA